MKPLFLRFDEPTLCNDYLLRGSEYIDRSCIDFPCHYVLNQVDLDTNLLDSVIWTKVALQSTKKPRRVGPQPCFQHHKNQMKWEIEDKPCEWSVWIK